MHDLSLDDDDDLLDLDLEDDILDLGPAEVLYDMLPEVRHQAQFCGAYASLHPRDDLELDDLLDEFHYWWGRYQQVPNTKVLEMAYLKGHAHRSTGPRPGLMWQCAGHPEFPGAVLPAELVGPGNYKQHNFVDLLIRLPDANHPRVRSNIKGGVHKYFRLVRFNADSGVPVDPKERFFLQRGRVTI